MTETARIKKVLTEVYNRSKSEEHFLQEILPFQNKIRKGMIYSGVSEATFNKLVKEVLNENERFQESVLDPINKTRSRDVFNDDDMMRDDVRKQILDLVEGYKKASGFDFDIIGVYLIGSITSFCYSETSDVDIDVIINLSKEEFRKTWNLIPKGVLLNGTNRPINLFILLNKEDFENAAEKAEAIYDVKNNKWIKKTSKEDSVQVPYAYMAKIAEFFAAACDVALGNYERDKEEFERYKKLDPETQEISEKEKFEKLDDKLSDLRADYDKLKMAHHLIFAFENEGYEGTPFRVNVEMDTKGDKTGRFSPNNIIYKIIDSWNYLEKLDNAAKEAKEIIDTARAEI